jgi:cytochrome c biogenesis protein
MKQTNQLWDFFASVKLALFTLCSLSLTSIIGTVIPQKETSAWYVEQYGPVMAQFFQVLDIPDMYSSWWFLGLLGLLCANLIICSIDRFPTAWRLITADQLATSPEKLQSMGCKENWFLALSPGESAKSLQTLLERAGWKPSSREVGDTVVLFAGKGRWSRLGVYIVHLSILIIFAGAAIGDYLGFKGNVMIPETESTEKVFASSSAKPIALGFEVRCDSFAIEYYDNGMPKEYRSHLTIRENGKDILQKDIEVNSPLTYKGITFYQSSYEAYKDFLIKIAASPEQTTQSFKVPYQKEMEWPAKKLRFGVINAEAKGDHTTRIKLWLKDGEQEPVTLWMEDGKETSITSSGTTYHISAKQMYATGLQIAKDPGVWLVYSGCILMLIGLYVSFFLSDRRIWLLLRPAQGKIGTDVLFAGATNKNKIGFTKSFSRLVDLLRINEG